VTYKIHKRKREDKESEVCIHGLPMKTRKTMKAMSRYGSTSRIMVEGGSGPVFITDWLSLTVKTALSPQTPIGITVCTPKLSFAVLPKGALSPKPVNYMPNLMDTLPFMRFKSTFVMDGMLDMPCRSCCRKSQNPGDTASRPPSQIWPVLAL
jgi:hypothetical protein